VTALQRDNARLALRLMRAESELSVLSPQCLSRRIPDKEKPDQTSRRIADSPHASADWHFTTADARVKLKCL
jgi:hypothetical protein